MARQNSSVRRVRPRRKSKGFKVVPNSLTWRWSGNLSVIERAEPWYCLNVVFRHSLVIVLFTRNVELFAQLTGHRRKGVSVSESTTNVWRRNPHRHPPNPTWESWWFEGGGGVYLLDDVLSWPFSVLFEMTLNILDIAPPSPLSDIIMLKLEIETCSKASAPSGSAGEASGCTDSMAWSERFNHLILLSVLMPTSDFSVRRCESSACIQTHWRCDQLPGNTVNEWHVHLKCVEAGGRIYLAVVETSP